MEDYSDLILKKLLEQIPVNVYWKNLDGKYLGCNNNQAKVLGFDSPEELIGKSDKDLPWKETADDLLAADRKIIENNQPESIEELVRFNSKEQYYLSHKIPLHKKDGSQLGILGISIDITDRKRAEALQKELEFQQRANTMLKLWSSAIAHEMRTPLTALSMNVSTLGTLILSLQNSVPEIKNSPRAMKKIDRLNEIPPKLEKTIDHANHFIDMTLMKSRAGDEEIEMNLVPLSMADEINAAIQSYPFRDGDEQFVNIDTKLDFKFMGESNFFHHVIFNLLKNALHYVKQADKGSILITTVPGKTDNILIFKDTGPGMNQENVDQLFKPFFSKTKHGTGVGLSLCHNLMGAFGGSISCRSVEGEFTEFKLMFPVVISDGS